jgi:hypothetical protein
MDIRCEITMLEIENSVGKKYKVTRRVPSMLIAETKIFRLKSDARKQLDEWLS